MAHYTASEIAAANDTDLPELLSSLGYQVRRVGRCYTTEEMDSLRIWNRRTWYRYSESVGGDARRPLSLLPPPPPLARTPAPMARSSRPATSMSRSNHT